MRKTAVNIASNNVRNIDFASDSTLKLIKKIRNRLDFVVDTNSAKQMQNILYGNDLKKEMQSVAESVALILKSGGYNIVYISQYKTAYTVILTRALELVGIKSKYTYSRYNL